MASNPYHTEPIYGNKDAIRNNSYQGHHTAPHAPFTPAIAPPVESEKGIGLAVLYEDLARLQRDNTALREKLKWAEKRYDEIIGDYKSTITKLEKENESLKNGARYLRTESSPYPASYDHIKPPSHELKDARDEIESLKAAIVAYEEDVRNIRIEHEESQRAKGILTREVQQEVEKGRRLENEIANLNLILSEYVQQAKGGAT